VSEGREMPARYDHKLCERWYKVWEERGYFTPKVEPGKKPFVIVIPPPNITGSLHMGHALNNTIQDVLIRWHRMKGEPTLWLPGTDHAGIATEMVVEREIMAKEGRTKRQLGREEFLRRVWEWKERYGSLIIEQLKRLGCSCDWSRARFTMDEGYSKAVREAFVRLWEMGLIYRGERIINWCPRCGTALSDLEVEHKPTEGKLYYIAYPFADGEGEIVVATTRPETMLGDTAVAVHPEDERYKGVVGRTVKLPLMWREIPVIADEYADPDFGTGAVKITPAHDRFDFEVGRRHNLPQVKVIGPDARMTEEAGRYAGLDRFEARERILEDLRAEGLLRKVEGYGLSLAVCARCGTPIEPLVMPQWFVRMRPELAEKAIKAVEEGKVRFVPERWKKVYLDWLYNVTDWCISRQIWWGHRIPVWYCEECGKVTVSREDPERCAHCGSKSIRQDPDVLDTWFSSALWPFATLGWPEETEDLRYFYPTSVLSTARDILYLWVARMIFCGMTFVGEVPFHTVYIHSTVLTKEGKRMSKSLGTGVDPLGLIEKYGADATRMGLIWQAAKGQDMRFSEERIEAVRNFCNKIWNATRFVIMNLGEGFDPRGVDISSLPLRLPDRWILSRYTKAVKAVTRHLSDFSFDEAVQTIYDFFWGEFCDWYVEASKVDLQSGEEERAERARAVLWTVLEGSLRLLHPFMPFITEELWQRLPHQGESIVIAPWPEPREEWIDERAEQRMEFLMEVVRGIRNIRADLGLPPQKPVPAVVYAPKEGLRRCLLENADYVAFLGRASSLNILDRPERPPKALSMALERAEVYVPAEGLVDVEAELKRVGSQLEEVRSNLEAVERRLLDQQFVSKAPAHVVERFRERKRQLLEAKEKLERRLSLLRELGGER